VTGVFSSISKKLRYMGKWDWTIFTSLFQSCFLSHFILSVTIYVPFINLVSLTLRSGKLNCNHISRALALARSRIRFLPQGSESQVRIKHINLAFLKNLEFSVLLIITRKKKVIPWCRKTIFPQWETRKMSVLIQRSAWIFGRNIQDSINIVRSGQSSEVSVLKKPGAHCNIIPCVRRYSSSV